MIHGIYDKLECPHCGVELKEVKILTTMRQRLDARTLARISDEHYKSIYYCDNCLATLEPFFEVDDGGAKVYYWELGK